MCCASCVLCAGSVMQYIDMLDVVLHVICVVIGDVLMAPLVVVYLTDVEVITSTSTRQMSMIHK
jgi:hypothetical protein